MPSDGGSGLSAARLREIITIQNEIVSTGLAVDAIMHRVAEQAAELTRADAAVVELPEGDEMVYRAAVGSATPHVGLRLRIEESLFGAALRGAQIPRCDDAELDPRVDAVASRRVGARSMVCVPLRHRGGAVGVLKVYAARPAHFDAADVELLGHLSGVIAAHMHHAAEFQRVDGESRENHEHALAGLRALARAIDAKDTTTRQHSDRVARLSALLAERLGWPAERIELLREAALVHDVGKIGVPDAVLLKPGRLDAQEYEQVKEHAALGARIVEGVLSPEQVDWIRRHHERPDRRGYPDGLRDPWIPEGAAIIAVADTWDVMTLSRPYSRPKPPDEALRECRELAGLQFRPNVVEALAGLLGGDAASGGRDHRSGPVATDGRDRPAVTRPRATAPGPTARR